MAKQRVVVANILPNEVLFPDTPIMIESRLSLDPKSAQSGIVVRGEKGQVRLSRRGQVATWSADKALRPGHHSLLIRGLLTEKQRDILDEMEIPFFVTNSVAKIPRTV